MSTHLIDPGSQAGEIIVLQAFWNSEKRTPKAKRIKKQENFIRDEVNIPELQCNINHMTVNVGHLFRR